MAVAPPTQDGIHIKQDEAGIKFYLNGELEPSAAIYNESDVAVIKDDIFFSPEEANEMSQLLALVSVFMRSMQDTESSKRPIFNVLYVNNIVGEEKEAKYTPRQVLSRLFSGKIVTVDKKKRIRFQFNSFQFNNGKVIINYNPVIW